MFIIFVINEDDNEVKYKWNDKKGLLSSIEAAKH
jgi:hypothetical protein